MSGDEFFRALLKAREFEIKARRTLSTAPLMVANLSLSNRLKSTWQELTMPPSFPFGAYFEFSCRERKGDAQLENLARI